MTEKKIRYRQFGGGKLGPGCYQLAEDYQVKTKCIPKDDVSIDFVTLAKDGILTLKEGFAFDGASALVIENGAILRAAAGHDAKYRLIREGLLDPIFKGVADLELRQDMIEDRCTEERADIFYEGVYLFGHSSIEGGNPILEAP